MTQLEIIDMHKKMYFPCTPTCALLFIFTVYLLIYYIIYYIDIFYTVITISGSKKMTYIII